MTYEFEKFAEASVLDLKRATDFIHHIKPTLKDSIVYAIEKSKPFDMNVVFHIANIKDTDAKDRSVLMISAEYILEHAYWKG